MFGPGYGPIEAQILHGVIRYFKPNRIIEVRGGFSTYYMVKALDLNHEDTGRICSLACIESYPSIALQYFSSIQFIKKEIQTIPFEVFSQLEENDLLFIDSSHTVKPGSDVNFLILEVLPRLNPGVIVHFHDIYLSV